MDTRLWHNYTRNESCEGIKHYAKKIQYLFVGHRGNRVRISFHIPRGAVLDPGPRSHDADCGA